MEYELTARSAQSIVRFRDTADQKSAEMIVQLLKHLPSGRRRSLELDLTGSAGGSAAALGFVRSLRDGLKAIDPEIQLAPASDAVRRLLDAAAGRFRPRRVGIRVPAHLPPLDVAAITIRQPRAARSR